MASSPRPDLPPVSLGHLVDAAGEEATLVAADAPDARALAIGGVCLDSRSVHAGDLYAALPGHVTHGARFAADAVSAGAVAVLTDEGGAAEVAALGVPVIVVPEPRSRLGGIAAAAYGRPADALQVLGVTGTNGKTTVAAMVESGLTAAQRLAGLVGTVGVRLGAVKYAGVRTTPEATDLHALLAVMRAMGADSVVMEVSSIALEEHRVDGIEFDVAGFTNLTQDHLDYHGTMEDYYRSKAALFTEGRARRAVVGVDDDWGRRLAAETVIPLQTWSLLDVRADWHVTRDAVGTWISGPGDERAQLDVPMPGAFNIANAVCAVAMLRSAGVPLAQALEGIAHAQVPGRMQVAAVVDGITGVVDYAHSPDSVERVLRAVRDTSKGRVIVVLGAGGDRDRAKRPLMGQAAARLSDLLVVTDDNPRSEDPGDIRRQVWEGARNVAPRDRGEILEEGDRARAISVAVDRAETGDVVLVLGKGHEQGQEVAGVVTPFDDLSVLRGELERRRSSTPRVGGDS
jgi:UDP-N-acetylmuramoyl-L-alanyl-D-glutamate--2,6-diaminopimelate ligase